MASPMRFVVFVDGCLLLILSAGMAVPMVVDAAAASGDWPSFADAAAITGYAGGTLVLSFGGASGESTGAAVSADRLGLAVVAAFGSLPFILSPLAASVTDAVLRDDVGPDHDRIDRARRPRQPAARPPSVALHAAVVRRRGIVVTAILLLPALGVGGMQLFRTESSDISDKPLPRLYQMARRTIATYVGLTAACAVAYGAGRMNAFDAVNHAMTTIADRRLFDQGRLDRLLRLGCRSRLSASSS